MLVEVKERLVSARRLKNIDDFNALCLGCLDESLRDLVVGLRCVDEVVQLAGLDQLQHFIDIACRRFGLIQRGLTVALRGDVLDLRVLQDVIGQRVNLSNLSGLELTLGLFDVLDFLVDSLGVGLGA